MARERIEYPCQDCHLNGRCINAKGSRRARFLVVTPPGHNQLISRGRHMSASSTRLFAQYMQQQGFSREDFVFASAIKCAYDENRYNAKERTNILTQCREYLTRIIEDMEPEVVIPLGAIAGRQVFGRAIKITKARGVIEWSEEYETWVLPMLDPTYVNNYPQHEPLFATDCKTFGEFVEADYSLEALHDDDNDYQLVTDLQFLIDEAPPELAFDVETKGLRFADRECALLSMQFCPEPGRAYMVVWDHPEAPADGEQKTKLIRQIRELLQNPDTSVIGQNLKYDACWVYAELGFEFRIDHDTLMLAALVDENSTDKSLDTLVKIHVPEMAGYNDAFNARYDKTRMDLVPLDDLVPYGCGDTDASLRLNRVLAEQVWEDRDLWNHYRYVSMPGLNAFRSIENRGQLIDEEALDEFEDVLAEDVAGQRQHIFDQIPRAIKRAHVRKGLNLSRRDFLADILFNHPSGFCLEPRVFTKKTANLPPSKRVPSTSAKDHLPFFFEECPFTVDLAQYVKDERLLSTNVRRFRDKYIVDGAIWPSYSLWTAVTGRTASQDPNAQNFPVRGRNAKAYKRIFVPPEGMMMLGADLSQAELRIAACMASEPTMLRIYQEEGDIHLETALIVTGMSYEEFMSLSREEQGLARFKAKAVNFGFIYGMGWRKFRIYAKTQYGVEFTEREAQRIRQAFFNKYYNLPEWHSAQRAFVNEHGFVRSYSGRIRHLPMVRSDEEWIRAEAERQAINSPVQEFASTLGVMAMGRLDLEVDPQYLAVTQFVHDAIYAYCPPEYVEWAAKTLKWYMETNPVQECFGHQLPVPIVADVSFGTNAADLHEMKGLDIEHDFNFDSLDLDFELPEQLEPPEDGMIEVPDYLRIAA